MGAAQPKRYAQWRTGAAAASRLEQPGVELKMTGIERETRPTQAYVTLRLSSPISSAQSKWNDRLAPWSVGYA